MLESWGRAFQAEEQLLQDYEIKVFGMFKQQQELGRDFVAQQKH